MSSTSSLCTVVKPPSRPHLEKPSVFFAGSIEQGKAIQWQRPFAATLQQLPVTVLNPRRDDWDPNWTQDISNPQFREQVEWEMDYLERADVIALFFQPGTVSPISLLELGLHASNPRLVVCCPKGFERRGNVQVVCHRYGIPLVETLQELEIIAKQRLMERIERRSRTWLQIMRMTAIGWATKFV